MSPTKDRPILFSGPMVLALLADRKTVTRRLIGQDNGTELGPKTHSPFRGADGLWRWKTGNVSYTCDERRHRFGEPGDRLWVRETWRPIGDAPLSECTSTKDIQYAATADEAALAVHRWRPSIHMPRWAARLALEVVSVRPERLHDITEDDALREGIQRYQGPLRWVRFLDAVTGEASHNTARDAFQALWTSINGAESWDANPWVWRVEFARAEAST
ncbi:hypothetical protein [Myxococcus sp. CA039A]|uniref:hypothetical protein n=1 Tax=Myxococcus sp. CA039A TaxID=2741737 RepID=UPI00157A4080|nr:hypothetical protein [Myxococcus sp. CA039A]NTX54830.1 hypothetical protein [Myxococcus sp. CA039A]